MRGGGGCVDLWWASGPRHLDLGVLSDAERTQVGRLRRPADRELQAVSFALRRAVLAPHAGRAPADLVFVRRCEACGDLEHGPPRLRGGPSDVSFSVSHAREIAVVAVACGQRVGVDVETHRDPALWATVLGAALNEADDDLSPAELWTAKEAALKALGVGLRLEPREVKISGARASVRAAGRRGVFQLAWARPTPRHVLAVAGSRLARIRLRAWRQDSAATSPRVDEIDRPWAGGEAPALSPRGAS